MATPVARHFMLTRLTDRFVAFLRWTERYTKTDMVYLLSGGSWFTFELLAASVFTLLLATAFGHFASQDTYGNYKYVLSLAGLLGAFSLTGIGTAITQAVARGKEGTLRQGFRLSLAWSAPMAVAALAIGVYYFFAGNLFLALALAVVAVSSPLMNSFSLFDPFLIGKRKFATSAFYAFWTNVATTAFVGGALVFSSHAIVLVVAYFAVNTMLDALFYLRAARGATNDERDPGLFSYGFHVSVMNAIGTLATRIDSIAVFVLLGPAELAVYAYAAAVPEQLRALIKNIGPLAFPKFAARSFAEIRANIWGRLLQLTLLLSAGVALYILVAPWIFHTLFPVYEEAVAYSRYYALSLVAAAVPPVITSIFQAHKKTKELYAISNIPSAVLIVLLPILTYLYGIPGAIASQFIYRGASTALALWEFRRVRE